MQARQQSLFTKLSAVVRERGNVGCVYECWCVCVCVSSVFKWIGKPPIFYFFLPSCLPVHVNLICTQKCFSLLAPTGKKKKKKQKKKKQDFV